MCQKIEEFFTPPRLKIANYVAYALMAIGLILRFILSAPEDSGIGDTPAFLYVVQFVLSYILIMLLIMGDLHKPAGILLCFPLLMSRMGRGAIIFMVALPITNFLEAWTILIAIIAGAIGILNISLGWRDSPVELKFAEEGVPERSAFASSAPPAATAYDMQAVPQSTPARQSIQQPNYAPNQN